MLKNIILLSALSLIVIACGQQTKTECIGGKPVAMFSPEIKGVSRHSFESNGQNASESLHLDSLFSLGNDTIGYIFIPIDLEILQAGCQELTQEFRIEYFDDASPIPQDLSPLECAGILAMTFGQLGSLNANGIAFINLAEAVSAKMGFFKEYKSPVTLQDGFTIEIDKMHNDGSTLVTAILRKTTK